MGYSSNRIHGAYYNKILATTGATYNSSVSVSTPFLVKDVGDYICGFNRGVYYPVFINKTTGAVVNMSVTPFSVFYLTNRNNIYCTTSGGLSILNPSSNTITTVSNTGLMSYMCEIYRTSDRIYYSKNTYVTGDYFMCYYDNSLDDFIGFNPIDSNTSGGTGNYIDLIDADEDGFFLYGTDSRAKGIIFYSISNDTFRQIMPFKNFSAGAYYNKVHKVEDGYLIVSTGMAEIQGGVYYFEASSTIAEEKYSGVGPWTTFTNNSTGCLISSSTRPILDCQWSDTTKTISSLYI